MQLSVKGKQMDVGDALTTHVREALETITEKYFNKPIEASVVFSREAHLFSARISVHVGRGIQLQGHAEADEPYPAFDLAAEKIAKRLRRHKRRLRDHHKEENSPAMAEARYSILPPLDDEAPENEEAAPAAPLVIAEMAHNIMSMTVSDAVMHMDLSDAPAVLFRNEAHGGLNMLYRRADGNLGWVDPDVAHKPES